jgi:hypothetical protein
MNSSIIYTNQKAISIAERGTVLYNNTIVSKFNRFLLIVIRVILSFI